MFFNDHEITQHGPKIISPFDVRKVQPASYDLSLHKTLLVPDLEKPVDVAIDIRKHSPRDFMKVVEMSSEGYILQPRCCLLGCTEEVIQCPVDCVISVEGKSTLARMFLVPHVAAGWIDPGFVGQITLEIVNLGPWPVLVFPNMAIAQMNVARMTGPANRPYGSKGLGSHYQKQMGPTAASGKRELENKKSG